MFVQLQEPLDAPLAYPAHSTYPANSAYHDHSASSSASAALPPPYVNLFFISSVVIAVIHNTHEQAPITFAVLLSSSTISTFCNYFCAGHWLEFAIHGFAWFGFLSESSFDLQPWFALMASGVLIIIGLCTDTFALFCRFMSMCMVLVIGWGMFLSKAEKIVTTWEAWKQVGECMYGIGLMAGLCIFAINKGILFMIAFSILFWTMVGVLFVTAE